MNCFYHRDIQAVGSCKSCQRGLCPECAVEYRQGLACRNRCEADVQQLIDLVQRNVKFAEAVVIGAPKNRVAMIVIAIFIVLFGLLFVGTSLMGEKPIWPLFGLGTLIASYGAFMMARAYRFRPPV